MDVIGCKVGNYISSGCIYDFFKTGILKVSVPTKGKVYLVDKSAIGAFDQIGLNHYSAADMDCGKILPKFGRQITNNSRYAIYPEGLYRALKELDKNLAKFEYIKYKAGNRVKIFYNKPIYITENGIAVDNTVDGAKLRDIFYRGNLYALSKAVKEGVNVRGYTTWTLMDNYEWSEGYGKAEYGICSVNKETKERKLKDGTKFLLDVIKVNS